MMTTTPSSLGSVLPLLTGAGCFSAEGVKSLANCSLQCHRRPIYSWSPHQLPAADNVHPPPIDTQHSPRVPRSAVGRPRVLPPTFGCPARFVRAGLLFAIRLMQTGAPHHVECGSLLPLSAAGGLPRCAPRINSRTPVSELTLGFFCGAVMPSAASRGSAFPAVCAGAKRSRRTSLRSPSHLVATKSASL